MERLHPNLFHTVPRRALPRGRRRSSRGARPGSRAPSSSSGYAADGASGPARRPHRHLPARPGAPAPAALLPAAPLRLRRTGSTSSAPPAGRSSSASGSTPIDGMPVARVLDAGAPARPARQRVGSPLAAAGVRRHGRGAARPGARRRASGRAFSFADGTSGDARAGRRRRVRRGARQRPRPLRSRRRPPLWLQRGSTESHWLASSTAGVRSTSRTARRLSRSGARRPARDGSAAEAPSAAWSSTSG